MVFVEFHRIGWSMEFARNFFSSHGRLVRSGYVCWIAARMFRSHVLRGLRCSREQSKRVLFIARTHPTNSAAQPNNFRGQHGTMMVSAYRGVIP